MQQLEFLALSCEEALFGGAAGGGKTEALLMAAAQFLDQPGYAAAIFRRTRVEALQADAPLARALRWFAPAVSAGRARFDRETSTFHFATKPGEEPSSLHFGYLATDLDRARYTGAAFQFIGVDELTFWKEATYRFLFSRLRGPAAWRGLVPNRMRCTTNPGGPGHRWVKERFVAQARHLGSGVDAREAIAARRRGAQMPRPSVFVSPPSPEAVHLAAELGVAPQGAYFVPAFAADNPALDLVSYRMILARLPPHEREWLEWGNWDAEAVGGFFRPEHFEIVDVVPTCRRRVRGWDLAATEVKPGTDPDFTAGVRMGVFEAPNQSKRVVIDDGVRWRDEPGPTEARVVGIAKADGREVLQVLEQEPGGAGKRDAHAWVTNALFGLRVEFERKTGAKATYWRPVSGFAQHAPLIVLRAPWTQPLLDELLALPVGHDDQADALATGFTRLTTKGVVLV